MVADGWAASSHSGMYITVLHGGSIHKVEQKGGECFLLGLRLLIRTLKGVGGLETVLFVPSESSECLQCYIHTAKQPRPITSMHHDSEAVIQAGSSQDPRLRRGYGTRRDVKRRLLSLSWTGRPCLYLFGFRRHEAELPPGVSLFKNRSHKAAEPEPGGTSEAAGREGLLGDGAPVEARPRGGGGDSMDRSGPMSCRAEGKRRRGSGVRNVPDSTKRMQ
eukprot:superscaffoldBa00005465_g20377